jgi:hypothetical protein
LTIDFNLHFPIFSLKASKILLIYFADLASDYIKEEYKTAQSVSTNGIVSKQKHWPTFFATS